MKDFIVRFYTSRTQEIHEVSVEANGRAEAIAKALNALAEAGIRGARLISATEVEK